MESMTNCPYYLPKARFGARFGNQPCVDGLRDGLTDAFDDVAMGNCAEGCAAEYKITRQQQDDYAELSFKRTAQSYKDGAFDAEITPVIIKSKQGNTVVNKDDSWNKVDFAKMRKLPPVFDGGKGNGTVTAGNASSISDGAAAMVLVSGRYAKANKLKVLARILSYADAAHAPVKFSTAPALAIPIALSRAKVTVSDIEFWEINEAFAVVVLANEQLLKINNDKVNVLGGAVSLGHPIGASGCRIVGTLLNVLERNQAKLGCVGICNGGGGASAMVIERWTH